MAQVWRTHVRTYGFSVANVLYSRKCLWHCWNFSTSPTVIQRPCNCALFAPCRYAPWLPRFRACTRSSGILKIKSSLVLYMKYFVCNVASVATFGCTSESCHTFSYWPPISGFQMTLTKYFFFLLAVVLTSVCASSIAFFVSASVRLFALANVAVSLPFILMMLFGGFLVNTGSLLDWLEWIKYISIFRYGINVSQFMVLYCLQMMDSSFLSIDIDLKH